MVAAWDGRNFGLGTLHARERTLHRRKTALPSHLLVHDLGHATVERKGLALLIHAVVLLKQFLEALGRLERVLLQAEDLEGLLFRHETALDAEPLLGDLLAALVREFLRLVLVVLLCDELEYSLVPLRNC